MRVSKLISRGLVAALALMAASSVAVTASAHEVNPIRAYLNVERGETSTVILVRNTRTRDLPIEVVILRRDVAPDGTETLVPADDLFNVFPPQFLMPTNTNQAIRVEYIGPRNLEQSQAYIVDVREIPVVPDGFTGIFTAYNFGVALYLNADGVADDLAVESIALNDGRLTFDLANRGGDYAVLTRRRVFIDFPDGSIEIPPSDVVERLGNPIVPPNAVRQFAYTPPEGAAALTAAPTRIRIEALN